jgi:Ser/Thr protein kinase RdoA (MazF antagonist)
MMVADKQVLKAWSVVLGSPRIRELSSDRVWEVSDQTGVRFVLKRISAQFADPVRRFTDEVRILSYLQQQGLPVAVPVPCNDGSVYAADNSGAVYALTPMLPASESHAERPMDASRYQNIGATIAQMHVALAACPFDIDSSLEGRGQHGPDWFPETWRHLKATLPTTVFDDVAERVGPWQEAIMHALGDPHLQRVHGDVHGGNILTDHRAVTGIIDVDHLPLAPRSYDLGYYMAFCVHWRLGQGELRRPIEHYVAFEAGHLLTGYDTVTTLTRRETDALPAMSLAVALGLLDYFLTKEDIVEGSWIRTAHWITDHPNALRFS